MQSGVDVGLEGEVTDWKALLIAVVLTIAGIVIAGASTNIAISWVQNTVLALATTLVSTGALALLFELALRRNVYREMLRLVGISRVIVSQQLLGAGRSGSVPWEDIFRSKSQLFFLLVDPSSWIDRYITSLLDSARQRPVTLRFFLPDPNLPYADDISASLSADPAAYKLSVIEAANRIERTWQALKRQNRISENSSIEIRWLQIRPLYSIALCDDISVISLTGVTGRIEADSDYSYWHLGDRGNYLAVPSTTRSR